MSSSLSSGTTTGSTTNRIDEQQQQQEVQQQQQQQQQQVQQQPKQQSKTVMGYLWAAREYITPTKTISQFLSKGLLTPDEFVAAGDELVFRCPTWTWESPSNISQLKSYLPPNKQYLITRNVPCTTRVTAMEQQFKNNNNSGGIDADDYDDDGEWIVSNVMRMQDILEAQQQQQQQLNTNNNDIDDDDDDFDIIDDDGEIVTKKPSAVTIQSEQAKLESESNQKTNEDDDNEYADMENYEDEYEDANVYMDDDDDAGAVSKPTSTITSSSANNKKGSNNIITNIRTYDLSITYDKYYQTPRIWMSGRYTKANSNNIEYLSGQQMMEDVISDYANRTVTIEQHPYISGPHASVHPCKHGAVMKAIIQNLLASSNTGNNNNTATTTTTDDEEEDETIPKIQVEMYLFIFLKFVSSIIPTINYDFTMDVTADTTKRR